MAEESGCGTASNRDLVSLVIPVYNEGRHLRDSIERIELILKEAGIAHEFVLVDDGSKDDSWEVLKELARVRPGLRAVRLSRNFGKEAALCAGLDRARGDACLIMDADLQHPPELIPRMVRAWREEGYEVVEGVKSSRGKEPLANKLGAAIFYKLLNRLSGLDLRNASDFKLLDAKVVESWKLMPERNTFFRAMSEWVGFKKVRLPFEVGPRAEGRTRWSLRVLFKLAVNALTSFSALPLQIVTFFGFALLVGSIVLGAQTLYMKFRGLALSGFTTVILLQLMIGSCIMISLGIIGTYIARIFDEVKRRPRYIVAEELNRDVQP